ncbi:MAG: CDGSH iron-sulfur domain-containing protein [Hyphomonadaceae bacterium JAD_PAG50586_4]|nr:MAG: CDGSH iron-sulfur domain-containing protein [Hyphomonadaceae bacterium JAD_PAG50586_4]
MQLSPNEIDLRGAKPVLCSKTAIEACAAIITEGEGASGESPNSHYCRFRHIRDEYQDLLAKNPNFVPAHPAATNPVLRRPPIAEGRVWLEDEAATAIVDVANAAYQTMLRLIAYSYSVHGPSPEKNLAVDLGIDLMKAMTLLGESAARRPAGPSNPGCNAGMSFTALRDSAPFPQGASARRFFAERMNELSKYATRLDESDMRVARAAGLIKALALRAQRFNEMTTAPAVATDATLAPIAKPAPPTAMIDGAEVVDGETVQIIYHGKLCIHSRFCVTGAPKVFLANVQGPWIHPDDMDAEELMAVSRECPSGAIQYRRKDGGREEQPPPVNLISVREAGPYAFRGDLSIDGKPFGYRATLCRCGASKNKPFCDGSHHDVHFDASGEPPTDDKTDMLALRDGPLEVAPQLDGPLMVRGNLEIISGTGRMVARLQSAKLCRCGHSNTKPYCDGTHAKIGFKST